MSAYHPFRTTTAILLAVCLSPGCTPGFSPISWDDLDYEEMTEKLNNPTGSVDINSMGQVSNELLAVSAATNSFDSRVQAALSALGEEPERTEGALVGTKHGALEGTNVFVKIACPGADLADPSSDFSDGYIRLDSPTLTEESISAGGILVTFHECVAGEVYLNGECAAYYSTDPFTFALDLSLHLIYGELDLDTSAQLSYDDAKLRVALSVNNETTVTVDADLGASLGTFTVTGTNGTFSCSLNGDGTGQCEGENDEDDFSFTF
jgi:hypothetical protein